MNKAKLTQLERQAARRPRPPLTAAQVAAMSPQERAKRLVALFAYAAQVEGRSWSQAERMQYTAEVTELCEQQMREHQGV